MSKTHHAISYAESLQNFCDAVLDDKQKVAVYSNNYRGAHIQSLHNTYLTVQHYLEPDIFSALTLVYVQHYPPTHWDLNIYGKDFSELLAAQTKSTKAKTADWTLLAMIARIEYAISYIYYGYSQQPERLPPYTRAISHTDFILQLQKQHPYAKIADNLDISQTLIIRHSDSKIYINNHKIEEQIEN